MEFASRQSWGLRQGTDLMSFTSSATEFAFYPEVESPAEMLCLIMT